MRQSGYKRGNYQRSILGWSDLTSVVAKISTHKDECIGAGGRTSESSHMTYSVSWCIEEVEGAVATKSYAANGPTEVNRSVFEPRSVSVSALGDRKDISTTLRPLYIN